VNSSDAESVTVGASAPRDVTETAPAYVTLPLVDFVLDEPTVVNSSLLPYLLMVASIIERRTISRVELIAALRKRMRQRRFDGSPRREYVLQYLHEHPP